MVTPKAVVEEKPQDAPVPVVGTKPTFAKPAFMLKGRTSNGGNQGPAGGSGMSNGQAETIKE